MSHSVDKQEDERDGCEAYQEVVRWYEGDSLTTETAEKVITKLDKINVPTKVTDSQYMNDFQQYIKHLIELSESYIVSKTVNIFSLR